MVNNINIIAGIILPAFFLILIIILITVYLTAMSNKRKQQELDIARELNKYYQQPQQTEHKPQLIVKPQHEEIIDSLNFMLENQILTTDEYNKLLMKCYPYINK